MQWTNTDYHFHFYVPFCLLLTLALIKLLSLFSTFYGSKAKKKCSLQLLHFSFFLQLFFVITYLNKRFLKALTNFLKLQNTCTMSTSFLFGFSILCLVLLFQIILSPFYILSRNLFLLHLLFIHPLFSATDHWHTFR
jgi:hypothetical protein